MTPELSNILNFTFLVILGFMWIKSWKILLRKEFILGFVERAFDYRERKLDRILANSENSPWTLARAKKFKEFVLWLRKPVFGCVFCMSSLHGTIIFILASLADLHSFDIWALILYCPTLMGMVSLYYMDPYDYDLEEDGK